MVVKIYHNVFFAEFFSHWILFYCDTIIFLPFVCPFKLCTYQILVPFIFSFKKLVASLEKEMECQSISAVEKLEAEPVLDNKVPICCKNDEISSIVKDLLDPSAGFARSKALQKYRLVGEWLYKEACQLAEKICCFEANIRRSYFHVKPLDASQMENWHRYLDFVEMQGDFDWVSFYIILVLIWTTSFLPPLLFFSGCLKPFLLC